jgi:hypothetical protein
MRYPVIVAKCNHTACGYCKDAIISEKQIKKFRSIGIYNEKLWLSFCVEINKEEGNNVISNNNNGKVLLKLYQSKHKNWGNKKVK